MALTPERIAALHRASEFSVGEIVLYGKWKNKRGRILRFFVDSRGVPMMEIEPVPKGRKHNKIMGLYNIWHLLERRLPKEAATSLAERWLARQAAYGEDFLKAVGGKRFRNPATGKEVLFESLPKDEQHKIHERWRGSQKTTDDEPSAPKVDEGDLDDALEYVNESFGTDLTLGDFDRSSPRRMSLGDVGDYDDFSSWAEWDEGELKDMDADERRDALESFRGKDFADRAEKWIAEGKFPPIVLVDFSEGRAVADGRGRSSVARGMGMPLDAVVLTEKGGRSNAASLRTACIIAGKQFGDDLCLLKNRDRTYDARLQIFHMEFNDVEMAFVLDLETGYLEGVNQFGIGIVNTTLMVVHDELEGKAQNNEKKTVKSKDGPKIFHALLQKTLDDAVESLVTRFGGIRGHTFVSDGRRLVSVECTRTHPALVHELDPSRINTRTNHGVSYPDAGYTHGEDYVSSVVRRWESQKRLQDVKSPLDAGPVLVALVDEADSPFNPVRVTERLRTTSQLLVNTTHPSLVLYLVPGHVELEPSLNLLPGGREPKIPVRVFRYKQKMEDRKKKAHREVLDLSVIDTMRRDFLTLMKNVDVVKDYDQALRWKQAFNLWRTRYNEGLYKNLRNELDNLGLRGELMSRGDAKYWKDKLGKEMWGLYIESSVPLNALKVGPDHEHGVGPEQLFARMQRELPKWEGRVRRAARQAWSALKDFVTWFEGRASAKMTIEAPSETHENIEGFQVLVRGYSSERYKPEESMARFKAGLQWYKQRARAVLPLLLQHQLPLVLDFGMDLDDGGSYHGNHIEINPGASKENVGAMGHLLAHEMAHHLYKHYLSDADRAFWDALISGNYGKLDLRAVLHKYEHTGGLFFNEAIRRDDPILYLQIQGLLHHRSYGFDSLLGSMEKLRTYLAEGGQSELVVHGKPITGYAAKNHEEAFCEAVGMLVGYGPQAVLPEIRQGLKTILPSLKIAAEKTAKGRYRSKKTVKTQDGDDMVVYEYGPRQVANRNKEKAERVENLRKQISKLRAKVKRDLTASDEHVRAVALAVALMDATYERVGNDASAKDGHFGVTTWRVKHVEFKGKKAVFTYVGKSGVDHVKEVDDASLVKALRAACDDKKEGDCLVDVGAPDVNEYLAPFDVTAKDIRGFHANREMKERLKEIRGEGPKLPDDRKERDELLKKEFKEALAQTAEAVGHTESTLRSQYLVPGLEDDFMKDGTVSAEHSKKGSMGPLRPTTDRGFGGRVLTMPLRDEQFVHFTPSERALEILRSKKLLMRPPYAKFGTDTVNAVSTTYGRFVPGVQTTHSGNDSLVGLLFSTSTLPDHGYVEEVTWHQDVALRNPKLISLEHAASMLRSAPVKLGDQDMVVYNRPVASDSKSLRHAAEHGSLLEQRMLAAATHAPVLVARDRRWWIERAPNVYRVARSFERPRPAIEGLAFPSDMFSVLWYEDEDGGRVDEGEQFERVLGPEDGAHTQHSQFPYELRHTILLLNDDGTSSTLGSFESTWSSDLVTAMVRSEEWDVADAIMVAGQACERCGNVLRDHYGLDGYPFASEQYWRAGTCCDMCRDVVGDPHRKSAAPKYEEYVRRKEQLGEHPLAREEWEARVLGGGGGDEPSSADPPSKESWEELRTKLLETHSLDKFHTSYRPAEKMLSVDNIGVAKEHQGKGHAGRAMRDTLAWADRHGITVTLSPSSDFGSSKKRLEQWYRSLGFVPNKGRSKDFRTRDSMIRVPKSSAKTATKTPMEREDEQVQKMLRREPKKKPPRYDLRNNRTLEDEDPDLDGLGGGDDGDPDLSMKWNKVGRRVAFRWLAVIRHASPLRVAALYCAKERDKSEFEEAVAGKKFRHPTTGNQVTFESLPAEEQSKIYDQWRDSSNDDEDVEDHTDDAQEEDSEEAGRDEEPSEEPEGGKPYSNDESPGQEEPSEKKPRTKDDVRRELGEAKNRVTDLQHRISQIEEDVEFGRGAIKELLKLVEKASAQNKATIDTKVKEEKQKLNDLDEELDEKQAQLEEATALVDRLKKERRSPPKQKEEAEKPADREDGPPEAEVPPVEKAEGPPTEGEKKPKPPKAPKKKPKAPDESSPPSQDEETAAAAEEALTQARTTLESLLGDDSDVARDLQRQIEKTLRGYDKTQIQKFSEAMHSQMQKFVGKDSDSDDAIAIANRAAKLEDLGDDSDPESAAERLAGMAYARNVVANPMVLGGTPVGGHEMNDARYGERAQQAFEHFNKLHKTLRKHAAEQIEQELRQLEPDSNKAQELNAILTGINTAHVAETGEALPGRPQPSAGHTALVRKLVETGNASHMFKPVEDFFADGSRKAMSEALREMGAKDIGSFVLGDDGDHPFSPLRETLDAPGISEYKQMVKDFLIQDFLNDTWGDRAVRDAMQAAGAEGADDPQVRAKIIADAKRASSGSLHAALAAMERVSEARARGEDPDPRDDELVRASFEGEDAGALVRGAKTLLGALRSKFKKHVLSPAVAVLEHFVKHRDPTPLGQETLPHPDENAPKPGSADDDHEAGDVWRTPNGNWRAKNDEGSPKTFEDREQADQYAGRSGEWSAEFDHDEERGPSKFAAAWLHRVRAVHPDDPDRPIVVFRAA